MGDISRNGQLDLVVFHVDNPGGENHGYYRIGWNLDAAGDPSGGWSDIKPVPGWFGAEDQGAAVALGDISGNGRLDLLIFHVDNPGGENAGYYRIGWDLDNAGNPAGGWSDIIRVPGWFGWENQGAGCTLVDINGSGRLDLVVFHIDNPGGENHGYFRIGWDIGSNAQPTRGWTGPRPIPGWFGAEDQGAGIAAARLPGTTRPSLAVLHVDNPDGENHAYFRWAFELTRDGWPARWAIA